MAERWELCFIADNSERVYRITLVNFRPVMFNITSERGEWRVTRSGDAPPRRSPYNHKP
jgi:hypothetical protein